MSFETQRVRLAKLVGHLRSQPLSSAKNDGADSAVITRIVHSNIGIIQLNHAPVNTLPPHVIRVLDTAIKRFQNDTQIKAVIVTGTKRFFCGGADINLLKEIADAPPQSAHGSDAGYAEMAHEMLNNLENSQTPFIAAVNGYALGGGCELALACHYRIMSTSATVGLVEATLGLIPGFGGTQRLTRLMGFSEAVYAIISGKTFSAKHATHRGIVDEMCEPQQLLHRAEEVAVDFIQGSKHIVRSLYKTDKLPALKDAKQQMSAMTKRFSAVLDIRPSSLNAMRACMGVYQGPHNGLQIELREFNAVLHSVAARAQLHLFFAQRATSKIDIPTKGKMTRAIQCVGIIDDGSHMGRTAHIAGLLILHGICVIVKSLSTRNSQKIALIAAQIVQKADNNGILYDRQISKQSVLDLLRLQTHWNGFESVDMAIECTVEELAAKQQLFVELERLCDPQCILVTNTTGILEIASICARLKQTADTIQNVIGLHFFRPASVIQVLEVVRTSHTSVDVCANMMKLGKTLGKIPVLIESCAGLVSNRILFRYRQSADFLIECGVHPYRIDRLLKEFRMLSGINRVTDNTGIQAVLEMQTAMTLAYPRHAYQSDVLQSFLHHNRLGRQNLHGFYKYDENGTIFEDTQPLQTILNSVVKRADLTFTDEQVIQLLFFPIVNECFCILDEGIVQQASDLDIISCFGLGFPRKRGGFHFWAVHKIGLPTVVEKLQVFTKMHPLFTPSVALTKTLHKTI